MACKEALMQLAILLDRHAIALTDNKVVKAEVYAQAINACDLMSHAKHEADNLRAALQQEVEQARQTGYAHGKDQAQTEIAERMIQTIMRLEAAHINLEARLVNTVMQALKTILGRLDEDVLMEKLVHQSVRAAHRSRSLVLRVAVSQFDLTNAILQNVLKEYSDIELIDVLKDPNLPENSCVLETEYGAVDGSLDQHMLLIQQGLMEAFSGNRLPPQHSSASESMAETSDVDSFKEALC
jgi:type III secretion protein L